MTLPEAIDEVAYWHRMGTEPTAIMGKLGITQAEYARLSDEARKVNVQRGFIVDLTDRFDI